MVHIISKSVFNWSVHKIKTKLNIFTFIVTRVLILKKKTKNKQKKQI